MYPFRDDQTFVRNAWYVIAWADEVGREILPRTVLDEPVVMYRATDGEIVVLQGTCAHKAYPLHLGRLDGDVIECGYHGFRYDRTGTCVLIPTQRTIPARCAIRRFPAVQRWQWIWAWMGDPDLADADLIPDHEAIGLTEAWGAQVGMTLEIEARYQLINDNLLDLTHLGFLHPGFRGSLGDGMGVTRSTVTTDPGNRFQTDDRTIPMAADDLPPLPGLDEVGPVDLHLCIDFWPPGFHVGRSRYIARDAPGSAPLGENHFFHAITPTTAHSSRYFFAQSRNFALDDDAYGRLSLEKNMQVIPEDKVAGEALEPLVDRPGRTPDFVAAADVGVIRARRWMQALIDSERNPVDGEPAALGRIPAPMG